MHDATLPPCHGVNGFRAHPGRAADRAHAIVSARARAGGIYVARAQHAGRSAATDVRRSAVQDRARVGARLQAGSIDPGPALQVIERRYWIPSPCAFRPRTVPAAGEVAALGCLECLCLLVAPP